MSYCQSIAMLFPCHLESNLFDVDPRGTYCSGYTTETHPTIQNCMQQSDFHLQIHTENKQQNDEHKPLTMIDQQIISEDDDNNAEDGRDQSNDDNLNDDDDALFSWGVWIEEEEEKDHINNTTELAFPEQLLQDNALMVHLIRFCDHVDLSKLLLVSKRFRDIVDLNMNAYLDSLLFSAPSLKHIRGGISFRWKNGYASHDTSLYIRRRDNLDDDGSECSDGILHDGGDSFFSWGEWKEEQDRDLVGEYVNRKGILQGPGDNKCYCCNRNADIAATMMEDDYQRKLEDAIGIDFSERQQLIKYILDLLSVSVVREDGKLPLAKEKPKFKSMFLGNISGYLMDNNTFMNGDENSYTYEIKLKCNEIIEKTTALKEFFNDFGQLSYGWGSLAKARIPCMIQKRHIACALFKRATLIRRSSFYVEDDIHAGFGPYYREGKVFIIELEDGRQFDLYGFSYYDGPYD